jgi:SET domain-containing protein
MDPLRRHNGARFINTNTADKVNCRPVLVMLRGRPVVVLFAIRDIEAGEELFYSYGDNFDF